MSPKPKRRKSSRDESEWAYGLKWSLSVHAGVVLIVLLKSFLFPGKPLQFTPSLQVDLVALPDVLKKDSTTRGKEPDPSLKKVIQDLNEAQNSTKEVAKKEEKILLSEKNKLDARAPKRLEEKNKRTLERLKSLEKIQTSASENSKAQPDRLKRSLELIKGNKLSAGHSLSGDAKEGAEERYYDTLRDQLNENFTLPPWLARQKYVAQVRIYLDANGKVHGFKFLKVSGNPQFDDAVKRAIQESSPFPRPPKELASSFLSDGIPFGFPL